MVIYQWFGHVAKHKWVANYVKLIHPTDNNNCTPFTCTSPLQCCSLSAERRTTTRHSDLRTRQLRHSDNVGVIVVTRLWWVWLIFPIERPCKPHLKGPFVGTTHSAGMQVFGSSRRIHSFHNRKSCAQPKLIFRAVNSSIASLCHVTGSSASKLVYKVCPRCVNPGSCLNFSSQFDEGNQKRYTPKKWVRDGEKL